MGSSDDYIPSSVSFSSSPNASNVLCCEVGTESYPQSLDKLSTNLGKLLTCPDYDYRDAEIEIEGITVGIHRCILASRSKFFHKLFKNVRNKPVTEQAKPPKYILSELIPHARIGYESFMVVMNYLYTGKVNPSPIEVSTCVDKSCVHDSCGPAINHAVEVMYASATFRILELETLFQQRLIFYAEKAFAEDVIPILNVAFRFQLNPLLTRCIQRLVRSNLDDTVIEKELPFEITGKITSLRGESKQVEEQDSSELNRRRIKKVHRALDSDDVALLKLLLKESNISLDGAYALHYAAAYCNPKVVGQVLNLGNANVNLRDPRGYTVLHVAARRKDLSIIVGLLEKGASVFDKTRDSRTAVAICRRLTRLKDFNEEIKDGRETNKDRLCVDVLEREMCGNPSAGNMSGASMNVAEDLCMSLLFYENRVAMARRFFPVQARLAMEVAHADLTIEYNGSSAAHLRGINPNEMPREEINKLQLRLQALQKTVETGRRFFPNCSEFLDRLSEDESLGTLLLDKGTPEEQKKKMMRFMEIREELDKAFIKDKPEPNCMGTSSASSSSPKQKVRRK